MKKPMKNKLAKFFGKGKPRSLNIHSTIETSHETEYAGEHLTCADHSPAPA